jgi:hypothetical protein
MSARIDNGGSAFPSHGSMGEVTHQGMSLRDYFAIRCFPVMYTRYCEVAEEFGYDDEWMAAISEDAYDFADALLAARKGKP